MNRCRSILLGLLGFLMPGMLPAQDLLVVALANGDTLTGEVVREDAAVLTLRTVWGSDVLIPVAAIVERRALEADPLPASTVADALAEVAPDAELLPLDDAPPVPLSDAEAEAGATPAEAASPAPDAPLSAQEAPSDTPEEDSAAAAAAAAAVTLAEAEAVAESLEEQLRERRLLVWLAENPVLAFLYKYYPLRAWNNNLAVALTYLTGESPRRDFSLAFTTERAGENTFLRFRFNYDFDISQQDGREQKAEDKIESALRFRTDIRDGFFFNARSLYKRDMINNLELELSQNVGVGYDFIDRERMQLSTTPSLGLSFRQFEDDEREEFVPVFSIIQDFSFKLTDTVTFVQEADLSTFVDKFGPYGIDLSLSLTNRISEHLTLSLSYLFERELRSGDDRIEPEQEIKILIGTSF